MRIKNKIALTVFTAATILGGGSSFAQDAQIHQRMDRLERDISTLSRAVYKGDLSGENSIVSSHPSGAVDTDYRVTIENRLGAMERQIQNLTGQIEELNHRLYRMEQKAPLTATNNIGSAQPMVPPGLQAPVHLQPRPAQPMTGTQPQMQPQSLKIDSAPLTINNPAAATSAQPAMKDPNAAYTSQPGYDSSLAFGKSDTQDYERAFAELKGGNYAAAQDGFSAFIEAHPASKLKSNAIYWLGETYYVQKQYDQAARVFARGYQEHPNSNKAQDNLLKLGLSLAGMGKSEDACITLKQLIRNHEESGTPVISRAKQESKKLKCTP